MKWNRIEVSWTRLKDKFSFGPFWSSDGDTEDYDLIDAEIPTVGRIDEGRPVAFRPDDRGKRSEFSLHISS